jgi:hypothetical protein
MKTAYRDERVTQAIDEDEQHKSNHFDHKGFQDVKEPNSNLSRIDAGSTTESKVSVRTCR